MNVGAEITSVPESVFWTANAALKYKQNNHICYGLEGKTGAWKDLYGNLTADYFSTFVRVNF